MKYTQLFVRLAVGIAFLSAVADRLGYWGPPGHPGVAWGNWANFKSYTHQLNFFVSEQISGVLAFIATLAETVLGILLILGYRIKISARLSGILLLLFATSMSLSLGIKSTFDYSVWIGASACFILSSLAATHPEEQALSLDSYLARKQ